MTKKIFIIIIIVSLVFIGITGCSTNKTKKVNNKNTKQNVYKKDNIKKDVVDKSSLNKEILKTFLKENVKKEENQLVLKFIQNFYTYENNSLEIYEKSKEYISKELYEQILPRDDPNFKPSSEFKITSEIKDLVVYDINENEKIAIFYQSINIDRSSSDYIPIMVKCNIVSSNGSIKISAFKEYKFTDYNNYFLD